MIRRISRRLVNFLSIFIKILAQKLSRENNFDVGAPKIFIFLIFSGNHPNKSNKEKTSFTIFFFGTKILREMKWHVTLYLSKKNYERKIRFQIFEKIWKIFKGNWNLILKLKINRNQHQTHQLNLKIFCYFY